MHTVYHRDTGMCMYTLLHQQQMQHVVVALLANNNTTVCSCSYTTHAHQCMC